MHVKVKVSLYMHYRYIGGWGAVMVLDIHKWSASHTDHFTPNKRIPTSN